MLKLTPNRYNVEPLYDQCLARVQLLSEENGATANYITQGQRDRGGSGCLNTAISGFDKWSPAGLTLPAKNVSLAEWFNASKENGNDEDDEGAVHA